MRLGVATAFRTDSADKWIAEHVDLGCKSVVFPLNCEDSETKIDEFAKAAKDNDVVIAEVGVWRNTLAADREERNKMMDYAIGQLLLADKIGARCCVNVVGTPHGSRWDGGYAANFDKATRTEIIKMIQTIIDEAKPKNTQYSIEPMPWMVPTSPDDYLQLLEEVERDGFGVHLDLINMVTSPERYFNLNEFMDESFDKLGDKICSCHLKDILLLEDFTFQLRECACGEGIMDIKRYLDKATSYDKDMPMIIEHLDNDEKYRASFKYVMELINK